MSVALNPGSALGFNRPLTQLVKRNLTITNNNAQPVAFKVKTTAPKLYCVRPNSGRVEPGESVDVAVMLQAMKEEPPLSAKCKDKFLIQSTVITSDKETMPLNEIWNAPEGITEETKVHQQKLKVVYLPPEGQTLEEEDETQLNHSAMQPEESRQFGTVKEHPDGNGHAAERIEILPPPQPYEPEFERTMSPPLEYSMPREEVTQDPVQAPVDVNVEVQHIPPPAPPAEAPQLAPVPVSALVAGPQLDEELTNKYNAALAEIERLRALLAAVPDSSSVLSPAPTELRRRHRAVSDDGSAAPESDVGTYVEDARTQLPEGVPLQIVVIIAIVVFITTYLFF